MENVRTSKHKGSPNEILRRERLLRGWSFRDVADRISCPDARLVRKWENGDTFPSPTYRQRLCEVFEKNAEELALIKVQQTKFVSDGKQETSISTIETIPHPLEQQTPPEQTPPEALMDKEAPSFPLSLEETQDVTMDINRQHMLAQVKHIWIEGLLEHSLPTARPIPLALYEDTSLIENPWRYDVQEMDSPPHALPCNTRITQVYDAAHGALLILGEPGAGKTTLLLTLASDLLQRAIQNPSLPIPVVFHLASWSARKLPLERWLMEELTVKYQVPQRLSQAWVEQNKFLLLLDGLDEVDPAICEDCIAAVNTYRGEHSIVPLVVCCRITEYLAQKRRLLLDNAVIIQPLTPQQINTYLEQGGKQLKALHILFADDPDLQETRENSIATRHFDPHLSRII